MQCGLSCEWLLLWKMRTHPGKWLYVLAYCLLGLVAVCIPDTPPFCHCWNSRSIFFILGLRSSNHVPTDVKCAKKHLLAHLQKLSSMSCNSLTHRLQIFRLHDKKDIHQAEYGYNWAQWNEVPKVFNTGRGGYLLEFFSYQGRDNIYMWHASWDHCLSFSSLPQQSLPLCPDIRGGIPLSGAAARNDYIARSAAQGLSGMRSVADTG